MRDVVAAEVRAMAARKGYKQVQIAAVIKESQSTVSRLLNGQRAFDIDHLAALAAEWDVPITDLLPSTGSAWRGEDRRKHSTCSAPSGILEPVAA